MLRSIIFFVAATAAAGLGGCGNGRTLVVVTVEGDRSGAIAIAALPELNGVHGTFETYPSGVRDFGLELPAGASGDFFIGVGGADSNGNLVSFGTASASIDGQPEQDLTVILVRQ